jgi:membrane protein
MPGGLRVLLDGLQFFLVAGGMAAMFRYVPNTYVRWGHAWMGGLLVSTGMEIAKKLLGFYLSKVPAYSVVYGAFATVPILLVWIYMAWVIVLLGATLTAYVPSLIGGIPRRRSGQGWQFQLAIELLRALDVAARGEAKGQTMAQLCSALQADTQRVEPVIEVLVAMDWVGQLNEADAQGSGARFVLLIDPATTRLDRLMQQLLLPRTPVSDRVWANGRWAGDLLRDVL